MFRLLGVLLMICAVIFGSGIYSFTFAQAGVGEKIVITTYYPSPYGSYNELRSRKVAIGDGYLNPVTYYWAPNSGTNLINANTDLIVEERVGVGTFNPNSMLHVEVPVAGSGGVPTPAARFVNNHNSANADGVIISTASNSPTALALGVTANGSTNLVVNLNGVGIGTATPNNLLHVVGDKKFRYTDGNQGNNKFLKSDGNGDASWADVSSTLLQTSCAWSAPVASGGYRRAPAGSYVAGINPQPAGAVSFLYCTADGSAVGSSINNNGGFPLNQ